LRVGRNQELIANLYLRLSDLSAWQFDNAFELEADRGDAKGRQASPELDDFEIAIETDHIDLEGHEKGMDAGRGSNP
jgi:hypothetical protein